MPVAYFEIVDLICAERRFTKAELKGPCRASGLPRARSEVWYLARKLTTLTLAQIGRLANRDHTTIMAGIMRCESRMAQSPFYARTVGALQAELMAADIARTARGAVGHEPRRLAAEVVSGCLSPTALSGPQIRAMAEALVAIPVTETTNIGGHHG